MSAPTVRRRDISYDEERDYASEGFGAPPVATFTTWTAVLDGVLSTGEHVSITRIATTRQEAANALASEIAAQGWGIL